MVTSSATLTSLDLTRDGEAHDELALSYAQLREHVRQMEQRLRKSEERRRALLHLISDLNEANKRLARQRKAMLHILADYEQDRRRLADQTERLDNSRRAVLHILQDSHRSNQKLADSRKAMIHIMDDLRKTTAEMQRRERELREKQDQLVQAGKLATLGELTTGVAHELNNPLNNIGLYVGNARDLLELEPADRERIDRDLCKALDQVRKASEIISHLRTFGRAAPASREPVHLNEIVERSLSLLQEQFRLHEISTRVDLHPADPVVMANAIQLEQVFLNLLTNARDAMADSESRRILIRGRSRGDVVQLVFEDTGCGIPPGLEQRVFDPFFTTKEVGAGTGLGLSIAYGIVRDHQGSISVNASPHGGASFIVELPLHQPGSHASRL
jgi:C4-dicarboxylate-specific signal transduction histidine kinase